MNDNDDLGQYIAKLESENARLVKIIGTMNDTEQDLRQRVQELEAKLHQTKYHDVEKYYLDDTGLITTSGTYNGEDVA